MQAFVDEKCAIDDQFAMSLWELAFIELKDDDERWVSYAADVVAVIAITFPNMFLRQLIAALSSPSIRHQNIAVQAARQVLSHNIPGYDALLKDVFQECTNLINNFDPQLKLFALLVVDAAAKFKPQLLDGQVSALLDALYKNIQINQDLITVVTMGPFQHKIDNGLEARKVRKIHVLSVACLRHDCIDHTRNSRSS